MADLVHNLLVLHTEDEEKLKRFHYVFMEKGDDKEGTKDSLSFSKIIPEPRELLYEQKHGTMNSELYNWRCDNWGTTQRYSYNEHSNESTPLNHIHFTTAWEPPIPILKKLSEICKGLKMTVYSIDEFMYLGFSKKYELLDGEIIKEEVVKGNDAFKMYEQITNIKLDEISYVGIDAEGNYYIKYDE